MENGIDLAQWFSMDAAMQNTAVCTKCPLRSATATVTCCCAMCGMLHHSKQPCDARSW